MGYSRRVPSSPPWTRRGLLLAGLGVGMGIGAPGLAGCTLADPRVDGPGGPAPQPGSGAPTSGAEPAQPGAASPAPAPTLPGSSESAAVELRLARRAVELLALGSEGGVTGARRRLLRGLRAAHLAHADVLRGPDPTARAAAPTPIPAPSPSATSASLARGLRRLAAAENAAAEAHRRTAVGSSGYAALLFGSLAASATAFAAVSQSRRPPPVAGPASPVPMPLLSDVAATQEMLRQLHAMIYGYQLALGRLKVGSDAHDRAVARLREHRVLRDRITAQLIGRSAEVPVSEVAYATPVQPRSAGTATRLLRIIETALAPFCGVWLAAMPTPAERSRALGALVRCTTVSRYWGAWIDSWPGWAR